jgi:hypothetical protein
MTTLRALLLTIAVSLFGVVGCAGAAQPSPTPPSTPVTTAEQAVARVIATEPRLVGITAHDPDAIGKGSWYQVAPASGVGAFVVTVRLGWGDCESGCIDEHRWNYTVRPDGSVTVVSEEGDPVPDAAWPNPTGVRGTGIAGIATAGPVCPVEQVPPDPGCAPRPVAGAVVVIRDSSGAEAARVTTAANGTFFVELRPGDYVVEPQPAEGLMGAAGPQSVTVVEGVATTVQLGYDTGIR